MSSSEGNCTINADVDGDYIFTFDRSTMKLSVTYPQLGGCYLKGSFNNWSEDHSLESGSVSVELTKGNHTFKIHEGEIFGFLGPNGAGKTTALRIISTLIKADSGEAFVNGKSVVTEPQEVRKDIGFLTSELKLEDFFTPNYSQTHKWLNV